MQKLADALVQAVTYLNCRDDESDESRLDDDVKALEGIAAILRAATPKEQDALAAAADRALAEEYASSNPRPEFIEDFANWMEEMFVDGWEGNQRVDDE